jgi:hypothetical protein
LPGDWKEIETKNLKETMKKRDIEKMIDDRVRPLEERLGMRGEPIYWDKIPAKYQWAANDSDGSLWVYASEPGVPHGCCRRWYAYLYAAKEGATEIKPKTERGCPNWKDTLVRRPEPKSVPEPGVDWGTIPVWCRWVAMDKRGCWYAYSVKPRISDHTSDCWSVPGNVSSDALVLMPASLSPDHRGLSWDRTLCERPGSVQ